MTRLIEARNRLGGRILNNGQFDPGAAWPTTDRDIAPANQQPLYRHPNYGIPQVLKNIWENWLFWPGKEMAPTFGEYIEGALEAAENALNLPKREKA